MNKVTGRIEAVGTEAKEMLGRTPGNITAIKPMKDGAMRAKASEVTVRFENLRI